MQPTSSSVILDISVLSGTANVLAQKQFLRALYGGTSNCVCQMNLEPQATHKDTSVWAYVSILTSSPLQISYTSRMGKLIELVVNKVIVLDDYIEGLEIINQGEQVANVSITHLK